MKTLEERFWEKVDVREDGCWHWVGARGSHGYGQFWFREAVWQAHRAAYEMFVGRIPDGLYLGAKAIASGAGANGA